MRARTDARLKAQQANKDNGQTKIEESPAIGEPLSAQVPAAPTNGAPISPQASDKPASWWRQFETHGCPASQPIQTHASVRIFPAC